MPRNLTSLLLLPLLAMPAIAGAEEKDQSVDTALPRIGQSPGEPLVRSAPPSVPFGINPATSNDNVLDFHGYLLLPLRVGVMNRENPTADQSKTTLHTPPLIPQNLRRFNYTGVTPDPWVQLNFTYGNANVSGTAIIASGGPTDGTGFYNPVQQLGVYDAFITVNAGRMLKFPGNGASSSNLISLKPKDQTAEKSAVRAAWLVFKVGAMTGRYGVMGAFDAGRYGTPLMFRTNAVGLRAMSGMRVGSTAFVAEGGFGGQLARPPRGLIPAGWNDFADPNVGSTFVSDIHVGLVQSDLIHVGLHYATAWSQDDQIPLDGGIVPDGHINVLGGDVRLTAGRFGHFYLGAARTQLSRSSVVSGVMEVLNARGGPELIKEYLGPNSNGNGSLTTFGGQYDISVARAVYDKQFEGKSPDLLVSLFGIATSVKSDDAAYDSRTKLKLGGQATYNIASWLSVSGRFDHVRPNAPGYPVDSTAFNIISPRLMFHTDWQSRDEIAIQYSHFMYGRNLMVERGYPAVDDPTAIPDRNVVMLSGTFWW
jgi:hypothetical protein